MQEVYLCLDVGGTEIKAAPLDKRGNFLAPVRHFPAMAGADRQTLLENFGWIFSSICPENAVPIEIDLAFPGPFDYKNGICLLQGLDKYDALYGCNLRRAFSEISGLPEQRIQFINDAAAFALGEMTFGQATQAGRALFVAVGTGCGSAFGVNGFLAEEGTPGVPPNGYFYNAPFRDSCVDDYISRRGLADRSILSGHALHGGTDYGKRGIISAPVGKTLYKQEDYFIYYTGYFSADYAGADKSCQPVGIYQSAYISGKISVHGALQTGTRRISGLLQQPQNQSKTKGLAACNSQTTSPFGYLNNFYFKIWP